MNTGGPIRLWHLCLSLLVAGCPNSFVKPDGCGIHVTGSSEDFTLAGASLDGVTVGSVVECTPEVFYIELEGDGTRELTFEEHVDAENTKCSKLSAQYAETQSCPQIHYGRFVREVKCRLEKAGVWHVRMAAAFGDSSRSYSARRFSFTTHSWRQVDDAARIVAEEMKRWDVANSASVAVKALPCIRDDRGGFRTPTEDERFEN